MQDVRRSSIKFKTRGLTDCSNVKRTVIQVPESLPPREPWFTLAFYLTCTCINGLWFRHKFDMILVRSK